MNLLDKETWFSVDHFINEAYFLQFIHISSWLNYRRSKTLINYIKIPTKAVARDVLITWQWLIVQDQTSVQPILFISGMFTYLQL